MTTTAQTGLTDEQRIELIKRSFYDITFFAQVFFPHIVNKKFAPCHKEIFTDLQSAKYYAAILPRGHGKSTNGLIIYPIYYAIFSGYMNRIGDISLISKSESFIINEIVRPIKREFETNELLLELNGGPFKTAKWSETYFTLSNGISFEAGGIGGQLRGGRRGLIVLDDLEDDESVNSEEQRTKLRNRVNKELVPKLLPGGQLIYWGTPISVLSYIWNVVKNEKTWTVRTYDCYKDGVEAAGHELWPEMLNHAELQRRKAIMGSFAFQAEYRCNPVSEATAAIKENQIRNWVDQPKQMSVVMALDPAYSEDEKADEKVCVAIASDEKMNRYLLSYINTHASTGEFIDSCLNMYLQYKNVITGLGLPRGGGDTEFWNSFVRRAEERHLNPPLVELKNTFITAGGAQKRNKNDRIIASLQPLFESGKYFIHANHVEAREQLLQLNSRTEQEHDDIIDAMAYAEQIITPAYFDTGMGIDDNDAPAMAGRSTNYGMD